MEKMNLIQKINQISEEAKNQFKPDLKKYGKNFRAISESAILEVLNPLFKKYNIAYEVMVSDQKLHIEKLSAGTDISDNLIERLVFVAEAKIRLCFYNNDDVFEKFMVFEGWGSGVDFGDKATGKAITAATKYALLKGLRLQYSDDPDAEESQEITSIVEKPVEKSVENSNDKQEEVLVSEGQLNYIKGLCSDCKMTDEDFKKEFKYLPYDEKMPMKKARAIIETLKKRKDGLPF